MKTFNVCSVLVALVFAVLLQGPVYKSSMNAIGGQQPVSLCNVIGYDDIPCIGDNGIGAIPGCTAGNYKLLNVNPAPDEHESFRELETKTLRGNCSGNANCATPESLDITSEDC